MSLPKKHTTQKCWQKYLLSSLLTLSSCLYGTTASADYSFDFSKVPAAQDGLNIYTPGGITQTWPPGSAVNGFPTTVTFKWAPTTAGVNDINHFSYRRTNPAPAILAPIPSLGGFVLAGNVVDGMQEIRFSPPVRGLRFDITSIQSNENISLISFDDAGGVTHSPALYDTSGYANYSTLGGSDNIVFAGSMTTATAGVITGTAGFNDALQSFAFRAADVQMISVVRFRYRTNGGGINISGMFALTSPTVTKTFLTPSIAANGHSTLRLTLTNPSNEAITSASLTDDLPTPLQVGTGVIANSCGGTLTATPGSDLITLTNGTVAASTTGNPPSTCVIDVDVTWPVSAAALCDGSSVTNTITPGSGFTTNIGQDTTATTASITCNPAGLISVSKTTANTFIAPSTPVVYTLKIQNIGTVTANNVTISDTAPAGLNAFSWTCVGTAGGAVCPAASGAGNITQTGVSIPADGELTYTVNTTMIASPPSSIINTLSVTPGAGASCATGVTPPCEASAPIPPVGMIDVSKTATASTVTAGKHAAFTITVSNTGTTTANGVSISDPLIPGVTAYSWTCSATSMTCPQASGAGAIAASGFAMPAGSRLVYALDATVNLAAAGDSLINVVSIDSTDALCAGGTAPPCIKTAIVDIIAPVHASVPALRDVCLWLLALLMAAIGFRQARERQS